MSFSNLFQHLWRRPQAAAAPPPVPDPDQALRETEHKAEEAFKALQERVLAYKKANNIASTREYTAEERAEKEAGAMAANAATLRASIQKDHELLQTGLTPERVDRVASRLQRNALLMDAPPTCLHDRLLAGIRRRVYTEAGLLAWQALESHMKRQGVLWPDPVGLGYNPPPALVEQAREQHVAESRRAFLDHCPQRTAELATGLVKVWKTVYPDPGSALWTRTSLLGVAAGWWCFYVCVAQALASQRREALEAQANEALGSGLQQLGEALGGGTEVSPEVQANVIGKAQDLLQDLIPSLVWKEIGSGVESALPGPEVDAMLAAPEPVVAHT